MTNSLTIFKDSPNETDETCFSTDPTRERSRSFSKIVHLLDNYIPCLECLKLPVVAALVVVLVDVVGVDVEADVVVVDDACCCCFCWWLLFQSFQFSSVRLVDASKLFWVNNKLFFCFRIWTDRWFQRYLWKKSFKIYTKNRFESWNRLKNKMLHNDNCQK